MASVARHGSLDFNVLNVEVLKQLFELVFALEVFLELAVVRGGFCGSLLSLRERIVRGVAVVSLGIRWSLDVFDG